MIEVKAKQTRIVSANNAEDFEQKLNQVLSELAFDGASHEIQFNMSVPYLAYVVFTSNHRIAETAEDEYEIAGETFRCKDCKHLPTPNDKRIKNVHCQFNGKLRSKTCHACEDFYKSLESAESFLNDEE